MDRIEGLRRYLDRSEASRLEVSLDPHAAARLEKLASFGISATSPEVARLYASRLLEHVLEDLGDEPAEAMAQLSEREPSPPQPGEAAPDAIVLDEAGEPVHLKDQWAEQTALLVFLRHYG